MSSKQVKAVAEAVDLLTQLQTYDATKKHPLDAIKEQVALAGKLRAANQRLQELTGHGIKVGNHDMLD